MSKAINPKPVMWLCSCLTNDHSLLEKAQAHLVDHFGPLSLQSEPFPFELSPYYEREMGKELFRVWFCFERFGGAENLPHAKLAAEAIEDAFSCTGNRTVNLDPGYLDLGKLVLASFKEAPDKIYMGQGVWAHTCLRYLFGKYEAPDHSFPDFKDGRFNPFFDQARSYYRKRLRSRGRIIHELK